ncbi:E3 ubiquitin-protein ligase UBR2-like isoform X2 [Mercenaria mercenaria]|uniref:E3 ubiquitin-protein ligase UBR2-like isoform X2 n=1 Tax=Mercenaria mercenaria TaxID=6596 RepID=UPI00234EEC60|nr:E3 ubiquitin-protein ligase UBR2-like isoform X2 [Mercenaria mercenaria]
MALRSSLQATEFSQNNLVQQWHSNYRTGDFLSLLKQHWREYVLVAFQSFDDPAREERLTSKYLFSPLEHFLCNGEPEAVFQQLKEKDQPSQLCGHVFKNGEPTYSCRECATDPTCVLCMECFQTSVHKQHRYRMSTSGGGGYCDCGDAEAWKAGVFCGKHQPQSGEMEESKNPMELLPDDLTDRASALFMATLRYTVEMLTWEHSDRLPDNLQPDGELTDNYVCMLFNDEVHTYEQVINTLQRAVSCTHKEAVDFATTVDREGRSTVTTGSFSDCEKARNLIERYTSRHNAKALKVQVMHTAVVAHQQFALRMIQWLQNIIAQSDGLRRLFCLLSMQQQENEQSLMEILLLADTQLWKTARVQSHQLMMAGVLMDQECKKKFSIIFTKHYTNLMKAFCMDDHDHDVSIASLSVQIFTVISLCYNSLMKEFILDDHYRTVSVTKMSVQIFTVPTLARLLVAEHNLLAVILQTFLQACEEKKNKDGKLTFERAGTQTFKRACFSLHDLKYALICKPGPGEWTDDLRKSFIEGFACFLDLLKLIEGMDHVKRQTGQHLEFEPEWEGAFNLQLKLEDNIVLFLEWCGSDRQVLIEAYNRTVEVFNSCKDIDRSKKCQVSVSEWNASCIKYDVSSQPISIHLPVTRLLAGLHSFLGQHGLYFESPDCSLVRPDPAELIELPLRVEVMVAQSNANMWRRNGYALINQIFFYHNVKCRTEMYDRDILMLQIGASMADGNEFLIHLLYKFGLTAWAKEQYDIPSGQDDSLRQTVLLAEEFLNLVVIVLSERYMIGVGDVTRADIVRREVIHQLCISPLAHSELAKALPEDTNHETGLEDVVKDVANFKKVTVGKGSQGGKGKYELKPEFLSSYNPYFYHYTKTDKSKSEEAQVKRKKENNESQALPPPVPPKFQPQFAPIVNLLQCDVMIYLMELILSRAAASRSRSLSETQLERILHLIGLALHEQRRAITDGNNSFDFLSKACGQLKDGGHARKDGKCIQSLLDGIVNSHNFTHDSIRDLVTWTIKTLSEVRQMKNEPVSMETVENVSSPRDEKAKAAREKKRVAAEKRRQKIMAQMSQMQKNFIKDNAELFENTSTELFPRIDSDMDLSEADTSSFPIAVGPHRTPPGQTASLCGMCILCQEEQELTLSNRAMVLTAFIQKSTVLALTRGNALLHGEEHDPLLMRSDLRTGSHTSSCGHMMHADCWQTFFDAILARERRRPLRFRHNFSYDIEKMEFLCPLCECISNSVIPVLPAIFPSTQPSPDSSNHLHFHDWLDGIHKTVINSVKESEDFDDAEYQTCPLTTVTKQMAENVAQKFQALWSCIQDAGASAGLSSEHREMLRKFSRDAYSFGLGVDPDDDNSRVSIMVWNTCAFSIQSIEQILRDECKPLFGQMSSRQSDCLRSLVKVAAAYSPAINTDIVKQHCIRLLSFLFPDACKNKKTEQCVLDVDMFHYLVALVMSLPSLHLDTSVAPTNYLQLPSGGDNDLHTLHLVMAVHLIQILLLFDQESSGMEVDGDYEGEALLIIYNKIHSLANIQKENPPLPWQLSVHVRKAMLPFLRCSALLYHNLTGVAAPAELSETTEEYLNKEFDLLCRYLGLNFHMSRLVDNHGELMDSLITRWCKNTVLKDTLSASSQPLVQYPLRINKLISLPEDYSELINRVSAFTCPKSDGDDSRAPTMCLVCGQMLCSQSYCCQTEFEGVTVGAATEHAYKCGSGAGIFLRVRECQILLLAGRTKGCFVPPPYIDAYGETDQGLRRGNPLHLCKESYDHLQKLWMSHAIPETIAHNLESNATLLTIDWQHL